MNGPIILIPLYTLMEWTGTSSQLPYEVGRPDRDTATSRENLLFHSERAN